METLETFFESLTSVQDLTWTFSVQDIIVGLLLSFVLTAFIGRIYKITHRGTSYTQSFVQTLVLMGLIVTIIMLIVGSNIARAFSLVGALSIIRFRNAVKETRDVGFIFLAMAIGMAMGTRFYLLGIIATVVISLIILLMNRMNRYARENTNQILKIQIAPEIDFDHLFDKAFLKYTESSELISIDSIRAGALTELIYNVSLKKNCNKQKFIEEIKDKTNNLKVTLVTWYNTTDL